MNPKQDVDGKRKSSSRCSESPLGAWLEAPTNDDFDDPLHDCRSVASQSDPEESLEGVQLARGGPEGQGTEGLVGRFGRPQPPSDSTLNRCS